MTDKQVTQKDSAVQESCQGYGKSYRSYSGVRVQRWTFDAHNGGSFTETSDHDTCQNYVDEVAYVDCKKGRMN